MRKNNTTLLLPVLSGFFVMGFIDIVGTATSNIKSDFNLSGTVAGLLPNFIFVWFIICSIPTGLLMRRIGRKTTVQISNIITTVGMLVPLPMVIGWIDPNIVLYLVTFALLGIGNTIIQVALNPLLTNIVHAEKLASRMALGQFIKAISSLLGPQIVLFTAVYLENWSYVFLIYAIVTFVSMLWLMMVSIPREVEDTSESASFGKTFELLKDKFLLQMFICILLIVGIDVGMNFFIPEIFDKVYSHTNPSGMNTLYFTARAVGTFICAIALSRISARKIFIWTMVASIAAYLAMMFLTLTPTTNLMPQVIFCFLFLPVGFATGNVFAIIFSFAMQHKQEKTDLISSLLIMGVAGGGAITLLMGFLSDSLGIVGGMSVLLLCMIYIFFISLKISTKSKL
jgi:fucose permease